MAVTTSQGNPGFKFFHHDNEHTLGTSRSEVNMVTPFTTAGSQLRYFNPHPIGIPYHYKRFWRMDIYADSDRTLRRGALNG